ncbi:hypothetical protein [Alcanivorax sediminis]|uniref:Lipoprotein n=1 Tax=Alcanivorax sediminis TaxID=2663008 RepID=A0A6N7LXE4_9GAMM|nr:hypothetical protein [Alcanivorax sediminis]MQX54066.1 hypothetical protein [Alcanivorax sediminis]
MRVLFALTALSIALVGCNGGEDFSGATVRGCPAGAGCTPTSRGEVLVELVGPRVVNLGYKCGGTSVVFFTQETETTSVTTNGESVTVPAYHALCPSSSQSIEFFVGSGLFEGNFASLGTILFPKQEALEKYTVTLADLENSPWRESSDLPQTRNIAALISGLDTDAMTPDVVTIPDEAHDLVDDQPGLVKPLNTAVYDNFRNDWSVGDAGDDTFFEVLSSQVAVAGLNPDGDIPLALVKGANRYTSAGNYSFRSCLFITCQDDNPNSAAENDIVSVNLPGRLSNDASLGEPPLILPNGKVMGLGFAARASSAADGRQELVAFGPDSRLNDLLQLENATIVSIEPGSADTDLTVQGRFLNKLIYNNFQPENSVGTTDIEVNYPDIAALLADEDKGALDGELLSDAVVDLPLSGEIEAAPQPDPNQVAIQNLADNGPYTLRLMRACLGANEPTPAECSDIPNPDLEAAADGSGNYFPEINSNTTTQEQPKGDYYSGDASPSSTDICLQVISDPGQPDNGIVMAGDFEGNCPNALGVDGWAVGFVSRTFMNDAGTEANSANLSLFIAPDATAPKTTSHFGVTVLGRVDMQDACRPMFRLSDANFDDGLRAAWIDGFYPYVLEKELIAALPDKADGSDNTYLDLDEADQELLIVLGKLAFGKGGAVQFFAGLPGGGCDPLAPAP